MIVQDICPPAQASLHLAQHGVLQAQHTHPQHRQICPPAWPAYQIAQLSHLHIQRMGSRQIHSPAQPTCPTAQNTHPHLQRMCSRTIPLPAPLTCRAARHIQCICNRITRPPAKRVHPEAQSARAPAQFSCHPAQYAAPGPQRIPPQAWVSYCKHLCFQCATGYFEESHAQTIVQLLVSCSMPGKACD